MKPPAPQQTRLKHAKQETLVSSDEEADEVMGGTEDAAEEIKEEESEGEPKATTPQKKKGMECYIPKKFRLTLLQHR